MAEIAEPLYRLTLKDEPYKWGEPGQQAFSTFKEALIGPNVMLAYLDWDNSFYFQTDASRISVGGILSQVDDKQKLRPLAYYSMGLNPSQRNYTAAEIECWALIALSKKIQRLRKGSS